MLPTRSWLVPLGLALLTALGYVRVTENDFIDFDDRLYVSENEVVKSGLNAKSVAWAWTTFDGGFWQPLTWMSFELDAELFGMKPLGFHVINVAWHVANVVFLFFLLERMTGAFWKSAVVAGLFGVHPMHVESVAWVSERKDVLSTFFWILATWCYVLYVQRKDRRFYVATLASMAVGLLAKSMLVTLPCVLLLLDFWPLGRTRFGPPPARVDSLENRRSWGWLCWEKVPLFLFSAVMSGITIYAQNSIGALELIEFLPLSVRCTNALTAYLGYLEKTFWPFDLALFYPPPTEQDWAQVMLAVLVLAGTTMFLVGVVKRSPELLVGWLWFLGTLFPVIGFLQAGGQWMADRFSYLPHIGLFITVVWGGAWLAERLRVPATVTLGLVTALLFLLTGLSIQQLGVWRDTPTIWEHTDRVVKDNHRAAYHLGLYRLAQGNVDRAEEHFDRAVKLNGNMDPARTFLGLIKMQQGKLDEAVVQFEKLLERHPNNFDCLRAIGAIRIDQKRYTDAIEMLRRAECIRPYPEVYQNLGLAYVALGQLEEGQKNFERALELSPGYPPAYLQLGRLYLRKGQVGKAVEVLQKSNAAQPDFDRGCALLGTAYARSGRYHDALSNFRKAVALNPSDLSHRVRLAWVLGELGDKAGAQTVYQEMGRFFPDWSKSIASEALQMATTPGSDFDPLSARELAQATCAATGFKDADLIDVLAVTHASLGDFDEAARLERQALSLVAADSPQRRRFETRLQSFIKKERPGPVVP